MLKMKQLSDRAVKRCKEIGRKHDISKQGVRALFLLTQPGKKGSIRKYFMLSVKINGKRTDISVGNAANMKLENARRKAIKLQSEIEQGNDPRKQKKENSHVHVVKVERRVGEMPTFLELAEEVHADNAPDWTEAYASQWLSELKSNANPILHKPVNEITTGDIYNLLKKPRTICGEVVTLWKDRNPTAKNVRMKVSRTLGYAVVHGYISQNPAAESLKGQLGKANHRVQHHKSLPHDQVGNSLQTVWKSTCSIQTKLCFSFLVLTSCRGKEVREATWDEIDLENRIWVIPAKRMKRKIEHMVPLSDRAVDILKMATKLLKDPFTQWDKMFDDNERRIIPKSKSIRKIDLTKFKGDRQWVYPSKQGKPLSETTLQKMLKVLGIQSDVHGYRASFKTWCSEQRIDRELAELCLAHKYGNATEQAYDRTTLLEHRREVMQDWADYINKTK